MQYGRQGLSWRFWQPRCKVKNNRAISVNVKTRFDLWLKDATEHEWYQRIPFTWSPTEIMAGQEVTFIANYDATHNNVEEWYSHWEGADAFGEPPWPNQPGQGYTFIRTPHVEAPP